MGNDARQRAWGYKGPQGERLLLLALAEHIADGKYTCWPSHETLSGMVGVVERQIKRILQTLETKGAIVMKVGRGRGHTTLYGLLVGLPDEQREAVKRGVKGDTAMSSFENEKATLKGDVIVSPFIEEKVTSRTEKVTFQDVKGDIAMSPRTEREPKERTERGVGVNEKPSRGSSPPPFFEKLAEVCKINLQMAPPNQRSQLGEAAARLSSAGATVEQLDAFAAWWWSDDNWRTKKARKDGRKPEAPRPREVQEEWGNAVLPAANGHKPSGRGPPVTTQPWKPPDDALSGAALREAIAARTKKRE